MSCVHSAVSPASGGRKVQEGSSDKDATSTAKGNPERRKEAKDNNRDGSKATAKESSHAEHGSSST